MVHIVRLDIAREAACSSEDDVCQGGHSEGFILLVRARTTFDGTMKELPL